jgi:hypothetical protein
LYPASSEHAALELRKGQSSRNQELKAAENSKHKHTIISGRAATFMGAAPSAAHVAGDYTESKAEPVWFLVTHSSFMECAQSPACVRREGITLHSWRYWLGSTGGVAPQPRTLHAYFTLLFLAFVVAQQVKTFLCNLIPNLL